jgi:hypothetical protein
MVFADRALTALRICLQLIGYKFRPVTGATITKIYRPYISCADIMPEKLCAMRG